MKEQILKAIERSKADYTEIRIEREWRSEVLYRKDRLENLESSSELGGIVRCLVNGGWGIVVFNSLDELSKRVDGAYRMARAVSKKVAERQELAKVEPVQDELRASFEKDPRRVSLAQKRELIEKYNKILLDFDKRIVSTTAGYADSFKEITFANSEGTFIFEERPDVTLRLSATARESDINIQTGFEGLGEARGFEAVEAQEEKAEKAVRRAVELLSAKPVKGGVYTVVLDQDLTGVFIHEAFGHLCEADHVYKNPRLREMMHLGRKVGVEALNVIDDGYLENLRGNSKYDDEGVPRRRTYLIKDGVLVSFLHSRETAAKMGAEPTGNARAISYQFEPIVRMRNTYIDNGTVPFEELIKDISYGIYACSAFGGQTELEQFTFSAAYAYEIVNGKIGEMLRDVVLTGNVFETLKNIEALGNDLRIRGGPGGCGKGGQWPLPITHGGPHIRIKNVTVGGRAQ